MGLFNGLASKAKVTYDVVKHSPKTPKILFGVGIVTMISGTVVACYKSTKLPTVVDENKQYFEHIRSLKEAGSFTDDNGEVVEYTDKAYRSDLVGAYGRYAWDVTKLYSTAGILTAIGIGCLVLSKNTLQSNLEEVTKELKDMTAIASMYAASYNQYRQNLLKIENGEELDKKCRLGLETEKNVEVMDYDDNGEEIVHKEKKIDVVKNVKLVASPYAIAANKCSFWRDPRSAANRDMNETRLKFVMEQLQAKFDMNGFVYLWEAFDELGVTNWVEDEKIHTSHKVVWCKGLGDDEIQFDWVPTFVGSEQPYGAGIMIDFNCYGPYDDRVDAAIKEYQRKRREGIPC